MNRILSDGQVANALNSLRALAKRECKPAAYSITLGATPDGHQLYSEESAVGSCADLVGPRSPNMDLGDGVVTELPKAELHVGAFFDCHNCGTEGFTRTLRRTDEELRRMHDLGDHDPIPLKVECLRHEFPDTFSCGNCLQSYQTEGVV